jgi:hypothetical protein
MIADHEKRHFQFVTETGSTGFTYIRLLFSKPLVAVFATCGGILLLACLNLASLLMARGAAREPRGSSLCSRFAASKTALRMARSPPSQPALLKLDCSPMRRARSCILLITAMEQRV